MRAVARLKNPNPRRKEHRGCVRISRNTLILQDIARTALDDPSRLTDSNIRVALCRSLALKEKLRQNKPFHKNVFVRMCSCELSTLMEVLHVYVRTRVAHERNKALIDILDLQNVKSVSRETNQIVQALYE